MFEQILVFTSVTYALKTQKLLAASGINSYLMRHNHTTKSRGCSYGLAVNPRYVPEAEKIAAEAGIRILEIAE